MFLHAYELDALSDEDRDRFEVHMLSCEHCFNHLKQFEKEAALLQSDPDISRVIEEALGENPMTISSWGRFLKYFWPNAPLPFRPAIVYILIAILIIPVYLWLTTVRDDDIRSVQTITLFPERSTAGETLHINAGEDGLITFLMRGASPDKKYQIVVTTNDGTEIFRDDDFSRFDEFGTGHLLLPIPRMKPGKYRLTITDPGAEPPLNRQEYRFRIED